MIVVIIRLVFDPSNKKVAPSRAQEPRQTMADIVLDLQ